MTLSSVFNSGSLGGSGFSTFIFTFSVETIVLGFSAIPTCFLGGSVETIVLGFSAIPPSSISNAAATSLTVLVFPFLSLNNSLFFSIVSLLNIFSADCSGFIIPAVKSLE